MYDRRNKGKWKRGSSGVEFALALPVFIILVIGIVEFGWYFFVQHTLQFATREGLRLALVGRTLTDSSGTPLTREASIIKTIRDNAAIAVNPATVSVYIYPVSSTYRDPSNWQSFGASPDAGDPGEYMRVRSTYVHRCFTPLVGSLFGSGNGITIQAEGTYRNELFG